MSAPEIINPPGGGGGGGTVTGTGTPGKLAKFTGTGTSIGNSLLSESGTTITSAATAETFTNNQAWTIPVTTIGLAINGSKFVFDGNGLLGINIPSTPSTCLHVADGAGTGFAGSVYEGVRLQRATEALFSSSNGTLSFRAGITASTAVVGTSTAHDLLVQRNNVTAATLQNGAIATVTLTAGGAGYTSATYSQQALTGGTGTGATADIVVTGGIVASCVLRSPGSGYTAADALSCATIGAGAGFVLTVATIAQIVAGSGNVSALGRIGAGTATPRAALDVVGGGAFIEGTEFVPFNLWSGVTVTSNASAILGKGTESALNLTSGSTRNYTLYAGRRINANAAGATTNTGIGAYPAFETAGAATTTYLTGVAAFPVRSFAADVTSTASLTGVLGGCTIQSTAGCTNTVDASAFIAQLNLSKAGNTTATAQHFDATLGNVGTVSTMTSVNLRPITGAGTIGTFYGVRIQATTAQTITNRWGISQEDTLASNQFSAVTNTFSGIVRATGSTAAAPAFSTPADTDTGMYFPSANTVRIGTGGSPGLEIDSSQTLKFNSGFGSTATAYGCRAWVNFIGATAVMRGSGGVSSLTRASAGNYTINFSTAMPDTGYSAIATKQSVASNADCQLYDLFASRTTTSSTWVNVEGAAVADSANINIAFFR